MGGKGDSAQNVINPHQDTIDEMARRSQLAGNQNISQILADYGSGGISLQDALAKGKDQTVYSPEQETQEGKDAYIQSHLQAALDNEMNSRYQIDPNTYHSQEKAHNDALASGQQDTSGWKDMESGLKDMVSGNLGGQYSSELNARNTAGMKGHQGEFDQFISLLTTNPLAAQRYLTDELQTNDLTKGLFGKGGMQDQVQGEASQLMGTNQENTDAYKSLLEQISNPDSYKLRPEDNDLYGKMSGDITRQFGANEQSLQQSLAARGLGASPGGASAIEFSGLLGNKNEQLANAQRQVAQDRVNQATQQFQLQGQTLGNKGNYDLGRLNSARTSANNLGALQETAKSNLFNRNLAGRGQTEQELANASNMKLQNEQAYQNQLNMQFQQQQATAGPSFGDVALGLGGAAVGGAAGAFSGGVGTGLAGSIFPAILPAKK